MTNAEITPSDKLIVTEKEIQLLKYQYDMFRKLQQTVLEQDVDYGFPAGKKTQTQKPSLYKSGAEKLTRLFNLTTEFEVIKQIEQDDFIMYAFKCRLLTQSGAVVGEGYGACNSKEKQGWNANPWAFQNTILKMAKKRSHVDAVLTSLGASNVFTQDLEDLEEEEQPPQPKPAPKEEKQPEKIASNKQKQYIETLINQIAKETETSPEIVKQEIKEQLKIDITSNITSQQASDVISYLQQVLHGGDN